MDTQDFAHDIMIQALLALIDEMGQTDCAILVDKTLLEATPPDKFEQLIYAICSVLQSYPFIQ